MLLQAVLRMFQHAVKYWNIVLTLYLKDYYHIVCTLVLLMKHLKFYSWDTVCCHLLPCHGCETEISHSRKSCNFHCLVRFRSVELRAAEQVADEESDRWKKIKVMRTLFLICFKKRHISQFDVNRYDLVLHFHQRAFATEKKKNLFEPSSESSSQHQQLQVAENCKFYPLPQIEAFGLGPVYVRWLCSHAEEEFGHRQLLGEPDVICWSLAVGRQIKRWDGLVTVGF